jgi:hypothetical protein
MTAHDLGLGGGAIIKIACYGFAGVLIVLSAALLILI